MKINKKAGFILPNNNESFHGLIKRLKLSSKPNSNSSGDNKELHKAPKTSQGGAGSPPPDDPKLNMLLLDRALSTFQVSEVAQKEGWQTSKEASKLNAESLVFCIQRGLLGTEQKPLTTNVFEYILQHSSHRDFSGVVFEDGSDLNLGLCTNENGSVYDAMSQHHKGVLKIDFSNARLVKARIIIGDVKTVANFSGANLEKARFGEDFKKTYKKSYFLKSNFQNANLSLALFLTTSFMDCNFQNSNCFGASFLNSTFIKANLDSANFGFTCFSKGKLIDSNLANSDFTQAFLNDIEIIDSNFENADFEKAYISERQRGSKGIINLDKVKSFEGARLIYFNLPKELKDKFTTSKDILDFSNLNLSWAELSHHVFDGANFSNSLLRGTDFERSSLKNAVFNGSTIVNAHLQHTHLDDSKFTNASIIKTAIFASVLNDAKFTNCLFHHMDFWSCVLNDTTFDNATFLSLVRFYNNHEIGKPTTFNACNQTGLQSQPENSRSINQNIDLTQTNLNDLNFRHLRSEDFSRIRISRPNRGEERNFIFFEGSDFNGSDLSFTDFSGESFSKCNLTNTSLSHANFQKSNFASANLENAIMDGIKLDKADCTKAKFKNAEITGDASFRATNVQDATDVPKIVFYKGAIGSAKNSPNMSVEKMLKLQRINEANNS